MRIKNNDPRLELYFVSERDNVAGTSICFTVTCVDGVNNKLPLSIVVDNEVKESNERNAVEFFGTPKKILIGGILIDEFAPDKQVTIVVRPRKEDYPYGCESA